MNSGEKGVGRGEARVLGNVEGQGGSLVLRAFRSYIQTWMINDVVSCPGDCIHESVIRDGVHRERCAALPGTCQKQFPLTAEADLNFPLGGS